MRAAGVYARVLVTVAPAAVDHRPALRVALGLAVPGVVLLVAGRPDLGEAVAPFLAREPEVEQRGAQQRQGHLMPALPPVMSIS